jgi:CheY-like chemotaxis protein
VQRVELRVEMNTGTEKRFITSEESEDLKEELYDAVLLDIAMERMANYNPSKNISEEEVYRIMGITKEDLAEMEDVEFE